MARTTVLKSGPFEGTEVEVYDGDNPLKLGTGFSAVLGCRFDLETGQPVNKALPPTKTNVSVSTTDSSEELENKIAKLEKALEDATKTINTINESHQKSMTDMNTKIAALEKAKA
jgi:hypothetical protein